jgi:ATP-dependent DNA helicase PIF1
MSHPEIWESYKYAYDSEKDEIVANKVGQYTQYPLMLAWAVTIHKSQGKTLDNVLVDLGSGAFAYGQVYVALSRCRSIDGFRLARPIRETDVKCDPIIKRFYMTLENMISPI